MPQFNCFCDCLTLFVLMGFPMQVDTIKIELSITYFHNMYFKASHRAS